MKAIVYTEYGSPDVLKIKELDKPVPKDNEVLVRVHASHVNYGDLVARNFGNISAREFHMPLPLLLPSKLMFGWSKPKKQILGSEFSGVVESVGKDVTKFKSGDEVFGYRAQSMGAYTEYLATPADVNITLKPGNVSFEEAASIPYGAITALNLLRKVKIQPGTKMLINGASGSIGAAALQLAKHYGAEVTAVCGTSMIGFVKSLGADKIIDYKKDNFTRNGETYDVIFDVLGKSTFAKAKNSLKPGGRYLLASFKMKKVVQMLLTSRSDKRVICALAIEKPGDIEIVRELVEAGKIKSIIDKQFPMDQAADAHRYAESGNKNGNVVITFV